MVITPEKFLVFERNEDTLEASIQISNISSQEIVYKVKDRECSKAYNFSENYTSSSYHENGIFIIIYLEAI